jgi:sialate O-acetylesterase
MVLQKDMQVPIWGKADPGETVIIHPEWQAETVKTQADQAGKWQIKLKTPHAPGPFTISIKGNNEIIIKNVLIGEVWFCSGQSNMDMPVGNVNQWFKGAINYQQERAEANYPKIRLFKVPATSSEQIKDDCIGSWSQCDSNSVWEFSAVGYFFGRELHNRLNVPVGMIMSAFGGTPAESWTSIDALRAEFKDLLERQHNEFLKTQPEYQKQLETWEAEKAKAKAEGKAEPARPSEPIVLWKQWQPGSLYNAMVAPIIPYGIKGAIWYQGESNGDRGYQYRTLFPAMIKNWRDKWQEGEFPFYYVQIANFQQPAKDPGDNEWAELREAQTMTMKALKNVGMAVSIDIGETNDIHPSNKQDVGKRLAFWALDKTYGIKDVVYSGPIYKSMKIEGNKIRLFFDYLGGGLIAKSGKLKQFAIAGADKKFVWADAEIDGDSVIVYSDKVAEPAAVRYAWAMNPEGCNLYNKAGLPASPFRTDDWPGISANRN